MTDWDRELARLRDEFRRESESRLAHGRVLVEGMHTSGASVEQVEELARVFHALAGTGSSFGFPEISNLGLAGERLCGRRTRPDTLPSDDDLAACADLLRRMQQLLAGKPHDAPATAHSPLPATPDPPAADVLVVEDDAAFAATLRKALESEGLHVRDAGTLAAAERAIAARRPDAVVADVMLPDGIVYPLVEQLRAGPRGETLPILALTGRRGLPDRVEAIRSGVDAFFTKPVDLDVVIQRLHFLLTRARREPARILSVDDDPQQAAFLRMVLESAGYVFHWCSDPAALESEVAAFHPHLVLMDVLLPGVSGYDLVRVLRQDERHAVLPIVFLTTEQGVEDRIRASASGADEFLEKPVAPALLLTTVAARIERARLVESLLARDGLTGLLTHGAFLDRAAAVIAAHRRREQPSAAFLMIDIDQFKQVNDSHGHATGDRVLAALGALLRRRLRQSDLIGRYGGEEFAAIVEGLDEDEAGRLAQRLLDEFSASEHVSPGGNAFRVTFSAGVAGLERSLSLGAWREAADRRLYAAKAAGRARVVARG